MSIPAAKALRTLQRALEAAGTTDREALTRALAQGRIPPGDRDLYVPLPDGLAFNDQHLVTNLRSMFTEWLAAPKLEPVVVDPEAVASARPRRQTAAGQAAIGGERLPPFGGEARGGFGMSWSARSRTSAVSAPSRCGAR